MTFKLTTSGNHYNAKGKKKLERFGFTFTLEPENKTLDMATGKFDKLEQVFEARVHKSLNRLGVLTSKDIEALSAQVAELAVI